MKYCFLLALLLPAKAFAQINPTPFPVRILDASQIFASYRWQLDIRSRDAVIETLGDSLWSVIAEKTQENEWPEGFRRLEDREENRAYFCDLKAEYLLALSLEKVLLRIPASENRDLPPSMQSRWDWYMVIREKAVEPIEKSPQFPLTLETQIPFLVEDFLSGYAKSMEPEDPSPTISLDGQMVKARFLLEGARSSVFIRSPEGKRVSFTSNFQPFLSREEAAFQYQDILQRMGRIFFKSCTMARQKERVQNDGSRITVFTTFDYSGDMDPRCRGLSIEIRLSPSYSQTGKGPIWSVQLSVSN
jgi:hypothetical protein